MDSQIPGPGSETFRRRGLFFAMTEHACLSRLESPRKFLQFTEGILFGEQPSVVFFGASLVRISNISPSMNFLLRRTRVR